MVPPVSHMRRDGEVLKLLRVIVLRIGREMVLDVMPLGGPRLVTRIEAFEGETPVTT